jgi:hypothetical protein
VIHRGEPLGEGLLDAVSFTGDERFFSGFDIRDRVHLHTLTDLPQNVLHLVKSKRFLSLCYQRRINLQRNVL